MNKKNIKLEFFLAPYPPMIYDEFEKRYPRVLEVERRILDYAEYKNINVIGSFNPVFYNFNQSHFYDGMHCKENAIKIICKNMRNGKI